MMTLVIVWWRDIPALVTATQGRKVHIKHELPARFAHAIDKAAMSGNARDEQAYLNGWHKSAPAQIVGEPAAHVLDVCAQLEARYAQSDLDRLIANGGYENPRNPST